MNDAECPRCREVNLTDYPVCPACANNTHFIHRPICLCVGCAERRKAWGGERGQLVIRRDELPIAA